MTSRTDAQPGEILDLLVIGGGVMGLFTAYHASERAGRVRVLERGHVGDPATASFGRTRTFRKDYLDPAYARLADEAVRLWGEFEAWTGTEVLVRCGCLNIAKADVTAKLDATYATRSAEVMAGLAMPAEVFDRAGLAARWPGLDADVGYLDPEAGVVDVQGATAALVRALGQRGAEIVEHAEITDIAFADDAVVVTTGDRRHVARSLVVTAGHGTNEVLAQIPGCDLQVPLTRDRPSEAKYLRPPAGSQDRFASGTMPVIAYLDTGIYLHPIVDGVVDAVKIGYYNPPDLSLEATSVDSVSAFVDQCLPGLADAAVEDVADVDGCDYDLVGDDDFVLGPVPGVERVHVGVGWRGTGYKFAPWVGRVLGELAVQRGTVYDIRRFDPARFAAG